MASRRPVLAALGPAVTLASGAGAVLALQAQFYACTAVLVLIGSWSVARAAWTGLARDAEPDAPISVSGAGSAQSELQLARSLLDQTPAPLILLHPDGALRAGNRAARRLFHTDERLIAPPADLAAAMAQGGAGQRLTVRLDTEAGPHAYAVSVADLIDPRGPIRLAILVDIQPELRAAEAAALRDLMQVLSHEIMNALTPVASLAASARDLLSDEASAPALRARDAVATLARRAEGLTRFVDAYRTLARLPEPVLMPVNLGGVLDEVAQLFRSRWSPKGVRLALVKPEPDIVVELDLDLMVHALGNILSNGAEAALGAGHQAPAVTLAAQIRDGRARLTIGDNGPGVRAPDQDAIFRPFFTTKSEGSGVGLSFARQVVHSHGGSLALTPSSAGAVFVLTL